MRITREQRVLKFDVFTIFGKYILLDVHLGSTFISSVKLFFRPLQMSLTISKR